MKFLAWKVRRKVDDGFDYFTFSLKREGFPALPLTANQFKMLFPDVDPEHMCEAPESCVMTVEGVLI